MYVCAFKCLYINHKYVLCLEGEDVLTVNLFHGGKLVLIPRAEYFGGKVSLYHCGDLDEIHMDSLRVWTKALGYGGLTCLYYRKPNVGLDEGLMLLLTEDDVEEMKRYALENSNTIDVYVSHSNEDELVSFEDVNVFRKINEECNEGNASNDVGDWSDELDDYDFADSDYSDEDDDMLFSRYVDDEGVDWVGRLREELGLGPEKIMEKESDSEYDSDDLDSLAEDEDPVQAEKKKKAFPVYKDTDIPKWRVGMIFTDHHQFREAVMKHSYLEGRMVKFTKSDRTRVKAVCRPPCQWHVFASLNFNKTMQIKIVGPGTFLGLGLFGIFITLL